ncbi:MAG TPA: lipoprotein LipL45 [Leptospiraceae bacterium]|nr:lipoprotein LipL45 [Leptospiraceae bacterium]HMX33928.1 lipoprotein LipL45 [Leptospiraceae bacterium]HMY31400.1 lipoprotein LipL45 [Leptospiraceae bacterium]HMZ64980.1 lipoprotein LipL45 [Leptospiraceae bacterium]HNA07485.1 lipoprotein LipL45 [Leptospiraceae bacterium]
MNQISIVFLLCITTFFSQCKKPVDRIENKQEKKDNTPTALVLFSVGESRIVHFDLTEERAALGSSFKTGDKITTGPKARVDIQINENAVIRLGANTKLDFVSIAQNSSGSSDTKLQLTNGKIFANVKKENKNEDFVVSTPTVIAGVRGTSFILEVNREESAVLKVVDGSVAVSPRVPIFEKIPLEEIDKNTGLKKINQTLQGAQVIIEKDQAIELPANDRVLASEKLDNKTIKEIISRLTDAANTKPESAEFTKNEQQELKTIVSVDPKLASEMIRLNEDLSSGRIDEAKADELEKRRTALENQISNKQEVEKTKFNESIVVEPKKLQSNRDIIKYYERIEKIILINGKTEVGAIINQEDSIMVVHTENGIVRINTNEIIEVIYDYQTKYRF